MRYIYFILFGAILTACSNKQNKLSYTDQIDRYEDSIKQWGGGLGPTDKINDFAMRYIDVLQNAYDEAPKKMQSATYLDRIHMWYATIGNSHKAVEFGEKVLTEFPSYPNKNMVLESVAQLYDSEIVPRDSAKVRMYYTQLLQDKNTKAETKEEIKHRLKYNSLTFEEFIMKEIEENMNVELN